VSGLRLRRVTIRDNEHADAGDDDREDLIFPDRFFQQEDAEDVGKKGRAVVDGGEVAGSGEVDGDIPGRSCDGEHARDDDNAAEHEPDWVGSGLAWGEVHTVGHDHPRRGAEVMEVRLHERRPWLVWFAQLEDEDLDRPEERPRAMREVTAALPFPKVGRDVSECCGG